MTTVEEWTPTLTDARADVVRLCLRHRGCLGPVTNVGDMPSSAPPYAHIQLDGCLSKGVCDLSVEFVLPASTTADVGQQVNRIPGEVL